MIDVNSFTTDVKDQILGILSAIGTNLVCPVIAAAAVIYCVFQIPQLFKAHRDGMSDVFWEFMWKEIIGLLVAVGTGGLWLLLSACLTHCVQKSAAQEVHPWAAAYFFIGD